ncbi:MAG: hypothetical protein IJ455_03930 [Agathobacter sp.]|nr:hypothetical protein [Agathobacter sp.]
MGKYQRVREIIREVMKDGKVHTPEELERACEIEGVYLHKDRGPIYNIVHQLKQKGEIASDGENGYISINAERINMEPNNKCFMLETTQVNLSDFEIVKPSIRRKTKQVVSVFENGDIAMNEALVKLLNTGAVEIRIKRDCGQLLLIPNGEERIEIGKNSRFKNYEIYEKLKGRKVKFPVYYVGEWNEENEFWLGDLTTINPNRTVGRKGK